MGWHEHLHDLFSGTERFFRPGYAAEPDLVLDPILHGVQAKLEQGALVADVGCGHGTSTILMAQAFPRSEFVGFDYHRASIEHIAPPRRKPDLTGVSASRSPPPRSIWATATTSWRCSTACTTWATQCGAAALVRQRLATGGICTTTGASATAKSSTTADPRTPPKQPTLAPAAIKAR
ncbi:MAG: methyltransferase domain-containing protein [Solirubrobacteraceae bacterium]